LLRLLIAFTYSNIAAISVRIIANITKYSMRFTPTSEGRIYRLSVYNSASALNYNITHQRFQHYITSALKSRKKSSGILAARQGAETK
jgi:hypothetical protein